jgi:hypothetical protein
MAALTNALQLMPVLKELHMASSLEHADGVRTVLQHAPKTITELDLSENPFFVSVCRARESLEQLVGELRAREKSPKVKISDPARTRLSVDGPPYTIIGDPALGVCARPPLESELHVLPLQPWPQLALYTIGFDDTYEV